jgi:hypothetical protein
MFRFTIRDVLWLTVVVALAVGFGIQTARVRSLEPVAELAQSRLVWEQRAKALGNYCGAYDIYVEWEPSGFRLTRRAGLESIWVPDGNRP